MYASDHHPPAPPPARRSFRDRAAEQMVALSIRSEPLGFLILLFVVWLAMQALRAFGKAF